jgi:hypothetical protein
MLKLNITRLLMLLSLFALSACNSNNVQDVNKTVKTEQNTQLDEVVADNDVIVAIELALNNADFRLFHSKGRRIIVPGLELIELSLLKSQCGLKVMPNSTDVLKTKEQRQQHKQQYDFAKEFNQVIYAKCLEKLVK